MAGTLLTSIVAMVPAAYAERDDDHDGDDILGDNFCYNLRVSKGGYINIDTSI